MLIWGCRHAPKRIQNSIPPQPQIILNPKSCPKLLPDTIEHADPTCLLDAHMYEYAVVHDAVGGKLGPGITGVWTRSVGLIFLAHYIVSAGASQRHARRIFFIVQNLTFMMLASLFLVMSYIFAWIAAFGICSTGPRALTGHKPPPLVLWEGEGFALPPRPSYPS